MNTSTRYWVTAIIILFIVIGGAYYLHSGMSSKPENTQTGQPVAAQPTTKSFALVVANRKITSGATTLTLKRGDTVSITITADETDELHLHGYDKSVKFTKGTPATLTFVADKSGRFPFEMEGSKTDLGELDVQP